MNEEDLITGSKSPSLESLRKLPSFPPSLLSKGISFAYQHTHTQQYILAKSPWLEAFSISSFFPHVKMPSSLAENEPVLIIRTGLTGASIGVIISLPWISGHSACLVPSSFNPCCFLPQSRGRDLINTECMARGGLYNIVPSTRCRLHGVSTDILISLLYD